ncbi:MAG: TPM domain-containing protein, partial [Candidatus Paceibacterota bacterium]
MKRLLPALTFVILLPFAVLAYVSPGRPSGFVNDFANVLPEGDEAGLESKLSDFRSATSIEISVATVPTLGDESLEGYAVKLYEDWGVGQKGKDNGLLILVAPNDRAAKIEVGYGLEGTVTDLQAGNVVNKIMLPAFKAGDYSGGLSGAVDALIAIARNVPGAEQYSSKSTKGNFNYDFRVIFFFGFVFLSFLGRLLGRTKSWWLGGLLGAVGGGIIGLIWWSFNVGITVAVFAAIVGFIFDFMVSKGGQGKGSGRGPGGILFGPGTGIGGGAGGFGGGGFGGDALAM